MSAFSQRNTLRPRQNGRHFPDDSFKWIFLNENVWISIEVSLKFVPKGPINNIPALVQVMAWRRPGDKPLSEPMMTVCCLLTHICVTRPQLVNILHTVLCLFITYHTRRPLPYSHRDLMWFNCKIKISYLVKAGIDLLVLYGMESAGITHHETETKWPPFYSWHFQTHFFNDEKFIFIRISLQFSTSYPICHQWFKWWLGAAQATSHYLNRWWFRLLTYICVTRPQWVNNIWSHECNVSHNVSTRFVVLWFYHEFLINPYALSLSVCLSDSLSLSIYIYIYIYMPTNNFQGYLEAISPSSPWK